MRLRLLVPLLAVAALVLAGARLVPRPQTATVTPHVLRYAFRVAETSFDPVVVNDVYSRIVTAHLFETLYTYDPLARPARFKPLTATAMPEVDAEFRRWTMHVRPGIRFADDPAFGGRPRELVAADYAYTIRRFADPANKSPIWNTVEQVRILGLAEARQAAIDGKRPFDYDAPIAGLQVLDRYTLRIELAQPRPRLLEFLAGSDLYGAEAREVVEHYGQNIGAHPVGTGPFVLGAWRRASRIVLERNPGYRERTYDAEPNADDAEGQAWLKKFKGRRLPMLDRVEIGIVEQNQPRWLAFLNGEADFIERVPEDFIDIALPGGHVAKNLEKRGIQAWRMLSPDVLLTMFNMEDPVIGGYAPAQVALRRAIGLGVDVERESRIARHGQMIPGQSIVVPHATGYDPAFVSEMSEYDPARARALLELYGWRDRDGDGWRETPDGRPLVLEIGNQDDQASHQYGELWERNMSAIGLKVRFRIAKWPENLKAARAGKLQIWDVGSLASSPDGLNALERLYGPGAGGANLARFRRPEFDAIYERMLLIPDGPERDADFLQLKRLGLAWMPYKVRGHRYVTDMGYPQVVGYRRPLFWNNWWEYVDVEAPARP